MYARVTTFPGLAPERIKATLENFKEEHLPKFEQAPGYRGMWAGVDYTGGRAPLAPRRRSRSSPRSAG